MSPAPRRAPRPRPVVEAEHLSLAGPEGPVFRDVSLAVLPHRLTALVGPSGSGRSSLLLALTGRMRGIDGTLRFHGHDVRSGRDLRRFRVATAVARLSTLVVPEARLTVAESVVERALVDGVRPGVAERALAAAEEGLGVRLDRDALVEQLSAYDRTALCVALALVRPADLVVLDDADADLDLADQRRLLGALVDLAADGPAVLVSTTEAASVPDAAVLLSVSPAAPPNVEAS